MNQNLKEIVFFIKIMKQLLKKEFLHLVKKITIALLGVLLLKKSNMTRQKNKSIIKMLG